ncbi:MAG: PQQ-binding-like beta-propeller repeat protein [Pseudomonadota bacterium]
MGNDCHFMVMTGRKTSSIGRAAQVTAVCMLMLAGCADDSEQRLPGERISIMLSQSELQEEFQQEAPPIALPEPSINTSYNQAGGAKTHALGHPKFNVQFEEIWSANIGGNSDSPLPAQPIVVGSQVFTLNSDYELRGFDLENGAQIWSLDLPVPDSDEDEAFSGGLAYLDGRIFVSTGYARLHAIDLDQNQIAWTQPLAGPARTAPTVAEGLVLVITIDNRAIAFNSQTGEKLWVHSGSTEITGLLGRASPAIDDQLVVLAYSTGELFGLRKNDGRVLWSDRLTAARRLEGLSSLADIRAMPVINDKLVLAVSFGGRMVAIDGQSGVRIWSKRIGGTQMPWAIGDYVFMVTNTNQLVCLSRETGAVLWSKALRSWVDEDERDEPIQWIGPILASEHLILANQLGELLLISPFDGAVLKTIDLGNAIRTAPVIAMETMLLLDNRGSLRAFR